LRNADQHSFDESFPPQEGVLENYVHGENLNFAHWQQGTPVTTLGHQNYVCLK
jgi:hypothetical protein